MDLNEFFGPNGDFQHAGDPADMLIDVVDGQPKPPQQLRYNSAATARDAVMTHFNMKGYNRPVLAGECIVMGLVTNCTDLRKVCFRGSEGDETNALLNLKTGKAALDAEGNKIPANKCILDAGEVAAAWPASDVWLTRVDCPTRDADGNLAGIPLLAGASGEDGADAWAARALGEVNGCYAIVVIPSADVPDLATLWVDVEIANGFAR